jgi:hypothetical protein
MAKRSYTRDVQASIDQEIATRVQQLHDALQALNPRTEIGAWD